MGKNLSNEYFSKIKIKVLLKLDEKNIETGKNIKQDQTSICIFESLNITNKETFPTRHFFRFFHK